MVDGVRTTRARRSRTDERHPAVVGLFAHLGGVGHHTGWFVHDPQAVATLCAGPRTGASSKLQFAMTQQQFLVNRGWVGVNRRNSFMGYPGSRPTTATLVLLADGSIPTRPPWRRCQHTTASGESGAPILLFRQRIPVLSEDGSLRSRRHRSTTTGHRGVLAGLGGFRVSRFEPLLLKRCRGIRALAQRVTQAPEWWFLVPKTL